MSNSQLGLPRIAIASLVHGWRGSLSVAMGVAVATAVIVGALLVGDSMRGSLRSLTLERLGRIDSAVVAGGFFPIGGITEMPHHPIAMFTSASVETADQDGAVRRASLIQVLGTDPAFWELDSVGVRPQVLPNDEGIVINESLAKELRVNVGDRVTVRLPVEQAVPADSPLGRRDMQTEGLPRMQVLDVIPDRGLGRFSLMPNQAAPQIVFADRRSLLSVLDRDDQANVLLFERPLENNDLHPSLAQLGLNVQRVTNVFATDNKSEPQTIFDYYSLTSDRLLLPQPVVERMRAAIPDSIESMTYLANAIETLDESGNVIHSIPYSIITAIDDSSSLPLDYQNDVSLQSAEVPLVINDWTARRLDAKVGTRVRIAYFEPEVENGNEVERYFAAVVSEIVPITEPASPYQRRREAVFDSPPTVYNDPNLTPTVPGVTDQDSISDWDLPFQLTRHIDSPDDEYWNQYRLTPKAYIPLAAGQRLFGSRFGETTGLRIPVDAAKSVDEIAQQLSRIIEPVHDEMGWSVLPIRQSQLAASRGTTPFDGLFLSLSFFVIFSAIMLIAMLFRLGIATRLKEFGTLMAVGWTPHRVASLVMLEGIGLTIVGVASGILGGIGYASLVLWALRSWWVGAVTVPFLTFHWSIASLVIGGIASALVAVITIGIAVRSVTRISAQTLLSGRDDAKTPVGSKLNSPAKNRLRYITISLLLVAVLVAAIGSSGTGQAAAGSFVASGMLMLLAVLMTIHRRLAEPRPLPAAAGTKRATHRFSLGVVSGRTASRHPLRSTLTILLIATASFLIIAITAFRLQPDDSGTGGFDFIGQTSQPLFRDLNDPNVRREWLGPDGEAMEGATIAAMRLRPGQDASCNNLYRAEQPTVLGIPVSAAALLHGDENLGFRFAASAAGEHQTPWDLLAQSASGTESDPIPVIIDQNTAMWSLQMMSGVQEIKAFDYGLPQPVFVQVVGLLSNSVLQGKLMTGESNFEAMFPNINGYQYFLIRSGDIREPAVPEILEYRLGDVGMDVRDAGELLASMLAVQNTYLRTFQSLGALGLLLGTIGLAISQLRGVLERRGELAIMRAVGFTRSRLATLVLSETVVLLFAGIGSGAVCAALAVLPYAVKSGLRPPILEPLLALMGIAVFGVIAAIIAVRRVMSLPLLDSLRSQ